MGEDFEVCQSCHNSVVRDYGDYIQCEECDERQCESCDICRSCHPLCGICKLANHRYGRDFPKNIKAKIDKLIRDKCYCKNEE
jgi:hypothetical protein